MYPLSKGVNPIDIEVMYSNKFKKDTYYKVRSDSNKKQIVIDVFIKLFGTVNKELVEKNIQYLYATLKKLLTHQLGNNIFYW